MIKILGTGLWVCAVTVGAAYGVFEWQKGQATVGPDAKPPKVLQEVKSKAINVPIIEGGTIQGYMIAQFVFTVDQNVVKSLHVTPDVYLLDEAFKTIYAGEKVSFRDLKKQDLPKLAKMLGENVNKRLGVDMVQDVLIDQLAFVPQADMRGNRKPQ